MKQNAQKAERAVALLPISAAEGQVTLTGTLPACNWRSAAAYYRRLEALLRRRCAMLSSPSLVRIQTVLYRPEETLCSIRVQAELEQDGRRLPFLDDGCVWNLQSGALCTAEALLGRRCSRRRLLRELEPRREPEWMLRSCPDRDSRIRRAFSARQFCLEAEGLRFLLPPLTLGSLLESSGFLRRNGK